MTTYESVFIAAPTVGPEALDRLVKSFEELIAANGGTVTNTIRWGRRKLEYEIEKFREGVYTIFEMEGTGETVKELERRFRINDSVLRFLTVKTERKNKLVKKGNALRQAKMEARSKRKASKPSTEPREERRA